jgi:alkylhydroperoxidase family enzyme
MGYEIRNDLREGQQRAWEAIASPGTWLTGKRRVAVAAEIRNAYRCAVCERIKAALSPNAIREPHSSLGALSAAEVELVHRVVNDPGRLSEPWSQSVLERGMTEGEYVEIVGLIAMVMMMDAFRRGLGEPFTPLPEPRAGEPARYTPPGAKKKAAWLPIVEPEDAVESDGPMYPSPKAGYIYRALSLVPQSLRDYWDLAFSHYLPAEVIYEFDHSIRAISRPQTELIAARISALHQCVY